MRSTLLATTLAGAIFVTAPATAQHGAGHGGGLGGGLGGGIGAGVGGSVGGMSHGAGVGGGASMGTNHGNAQLGAGATTRAEARQNSQGPAHAADRALSRANENSVLHGSSRSSGSLANLRTGLAVRDSAGANLGTISRINRSADGTVRNILVKSASGARKVITLAPDTLTLNGDVVTTTRLATSSGRR